VQYELHLDQFLSVASRLLGPDDIRTVIELGARDGSETAEFARRLPRAHIYTFECNPQTFPQCRSTVSGLQQVELVEKAVADRDGPITFFPIDPERTETTWEDGNPGASSLLRASGKYPVETFAQGEIMVEGTSLRSFMAERDLSGVDLLWMDIQGAELMALEGLGDRIAQVKLIHTEVEFLDGPAALLGRQAVPERGRLPVGRVHDDGRLFRRRRLRERRGARPLRPPPRTDHRFDAAVLETLPVPQDRRG
jgi:FkbM family methyltransferase